MNAQRFSRASRSFINLTALAAAFSVCGTAGATTTPDSATSTLTGGTVNYVYKEFTPNDAGETGSDGNATELQWVGRPTSGTILDTLLIIFPGGGQIGLEFCTGYGDRSPPDTSKQDTCRQAIAAGYHVLAINHHSTRNHGPYDECIADGKAADDTPGNPLDRCLYATRYFTILGTLPPNNTPPALGSYTYTSSDVASAYRSGGDNFGLPIAKNGASFLNTRLMKDILYMDGQDTGSGHGSWKQFCKNTTSCITGLDWDRVHVIGGSQGTGYAAFMSKVITLPHVGLMSGPCDMLNEAGDPNIPPSWMGYYPTGATPASVIFSVRHIDDDIGYAGGGGLCGQAVENLDAMGISATTNQFLVPDSKQSTGDLIGTCWTTGITNDVSPHSGPAFCGNNYNGPGFSNRIPNKSGSGWSNGVWTNKIF